MPNLAFPALSAHARLCVSPLLCSGICGSATAAGKADPLPASPWGRWRVTQVKWRVQRLTFCFVPVAETIMCMCMAPTRPQSGAATHPTLQLTATETDVVAWQPGSWRWFAFAPSAKCSALRWRFAKVTYAIASAPPVVFEIPTSSAAGACVANTQFLSQIHWNVVCCLCRCRTMVGITVHGDSHRYF